MKNFILLILSLLYAAPVFGADKVSIKSGGWNESTTWSPSGVPLATDNVTISPAHNVNINAPAACGSIYVSANAILRFTGNLGMSLTVQNIHVNASGSFLVQQNSTHTLNVSGNIVNEGVFSMRSSNNGVCNVVFTKNGSQSVSGSGPTLEFAGITLNMGSSYQNVLEITSSAFNSGTAFLKLLNGTFKYSSPGAKSVIPFGEAANIPATAGIWLNAAGANLSTPGILSYSGLLRISAGILNVGNNMNENLVSQGGSLVVNGGSVNISGCYDARSAASSFSMSNGLLTVPVVNSLDQIVSPFHFTGSGSVFNFTGGKIIVTREGGNGAQDLGYINTASSAPSITGGTLQIGNAVWAPGQKINVLSTVTIPNLLLGSLTVTANLVSSASVLRDVIFADDGVLSANSHELQVGGNWTGAGVFIAGTSSVTFNSTDPQSISKTAPEAFYHLRLLNSSVKSLQCNVSVATDLIIGTSATVDASPANSSLTISGNFVNNGEFLPQKGLVTMNGSSAQNISGTAWNKFYDLTLDNLAGVTLGTPLDLYGSLTMKNGVFAVTGQSVTLISNSNGTARVAEISGTGDISGSVTLQRYVPGGATGWAQFGISMSSPVSLSDWDDDLFITCPTCPDGYLNFYSVYGYNEAAAGLMGDPMSYVPMAPITQTLQSERGYWVYTGTAQFTTAPITLDVTGDVTKFTRTIPLSYSNYGQPGEDGWNLICNPYPSPISWAALRGTTPGIDDAVYVFNADLNNGTGGYASFVNGVSSPLATAGGIGDAIPAGQGFFVHSTGATALIAQESNKVASDASLLKYAGQSARPLLRLGLKGLGGRSDETVLYFEENATASFDEGFDAYKLKGFDPKSPAIASQKSGVLFHINGLAPVKGTFSVDLKVVSGYAGSYTIAANEITAFNRGACIRLQDRYTSVITDLRTGPYVFWLSDTTKAARFLLLITDNDLSADISITQPSCTEPQAGHITANAKSQGPWNYYWKLNGKTLRTALEKAGADTLSGLSVGEVELEITTKGACDHHASTYQVLQQTPVVSKFSSVDTVNLSLSPVIQFLNISEGASENYWDFGAGDELLSAFSPTFAYAVPGTYEVSLYGISTTGCSDTAVKRITVIDGITGMFNDRSPACLLLLNKGENRYEVILPPHTPQWWSARLHNATGSLVADFGKKFEDQIRLPLDLSGQAPGLYLLTISASDIYVVKLIVQY